MISVTLQESQLQMVKITNRVGKCRMMIDLIAAHFLTIDGENATNQRPANSMTGCPHTQNCMR